MRLRLAGALAVLAVGTRAHRRPRRAGRLPAVRLRGRLPRVRRGRHPPVVLRRPLRPVGQGRGPAARLRRPPHPRGLLPPRATPAGRPGQASRVSAAPTRPGSARTSSWTSTAHPAGRSTRAWRGSSPSCPPAASSRWSGSTSTTSSAASAGERAADLGPCASTPRSRPTRPLRSLRVIGPSLVYPNAAAGCWATSRPTSTPGTSTPTPAPPLPRTRSTSRLSVADQGRLGLQAGRGHRAGLPHLAGRHERRPARRRRADGGGLHAAHGPRALRRRHRQDLPLRAARPAREPPELPVELRAAAHRLLAQARLHAAQEPPRADRLVGPGEGHARRLQRGRHHDRCPHARPPAGRRGATRSCCGGRRASGTATPSGG